MTYRSPSLSTATVSGIGTYSPVCPALTNASLVSSTEAFLMKVGSCGFRQMPSYSIVTAIEPTLKRRNPEPWPGSGTPEGADGEAWAKAARSNRMGPAIPKAAAARVAERIMRRVGFIGLGPSQWPGCQTMLP